MKLKRLFTLLITLALLLSSAFVCSLSVSAQYDYLFPVNNGGVIGYQYGYTEAYGSFHVGIDLHARTGDDTIYAAYSGYVGATANSCYHVSYGAPCEHYATFGNYIRINQDDGTYAFYGHLKQDSLLVKTGDYVVKGQPIATMGSSGYSTGKHLHFEVRTKLGDSSSHINVNSKELGGLINYSYTGYGATVSYEAIEDGTYYLKNSNGLYMSVLEGVEADGQNILASEFASLDAQKIEFEKTADGYQLRPLCADNSVVNNYGYTVADGNNVTLWEITDHVSQKWNFESVEGGYVIRSAMNENCCIAVTADNDVRIATYTGASNQIWTIESTVTFDANGGEGAPDTVFKAYGEEITLPEDAPEREGYIFLGWAEDKDAEFATYATGSIFGSDSSTTLYAIWAASDKPLGSNLAYLKDYTVSGSGVGYDSYVADLTDGKHYENVSYDDKWFAFYYNSDAEESVINAPNGVGTLVIDLEDVYTLTAVNIHLINISHASAVKPASINIFVSEDGSTFTPAGAMPLTDAEPNAYWSFTNVSGNARYVKLEFTLADYFCFVNEIEVYGTVVGADPYLLGDVNLDGAIDQYDYILVKRHYFETRYLTDDEFVRGDVNSDGVVNQYDYILICRHYFGTFVIK